MQMLPADLGNRLVEYVKRQRHQFGNVCSWTELLRGLSDGELSNLAKAISQIESQPGQLDWAFEGLKINSTLAVEAMMVMGGREYAKKMRTTYDEAALGQRDELKPKIMELHK